MDTLIEVCPTSINTKQGIEFGRMEMELVGYIKGSPDQRNLQNLLNGTLKLVAVTERELAFLSSNSTKLTLILQEVLELKELIKNNNDK